jgi:carbamoyltransferase
MDDKRIVVGINSSGNMSSACLFMDGRIKYAIAEERVSRRKQDVSFPLKAIKYCCQAAGVDIHKVTDLFVGWNPRYYIHRSNATLGDAYQNRGKVAYLAMNELATLLDHDPKAIEPPITEIMQQLKTVKATWNIHFVDHHKAHLSNAYFQSGFDKADFMIADGFGEASSGFVGRVGPGKIESFGVNRTPHSLGLFYSTFTDFLGFRHNSEEWKIMALASLGNPRKYYDVIRRMLKVNGLTYEMDLSFFESYMFFTPQYYSPKMVELFGPPLQKGQELTSRHFDIVAAVQKVVEDVFFEILNNLHKKTGGKRLVLNGGVIMNSVMNGKIHERTPYKDIFIGGSPDDSGISIGSAFYGWSHVLKRKTLPARLKHNYFGKTYSGEAIEKELVRRKIGFSRVADPAKKAAELIRRKKIVAWFQGASEFGQRALGNRSILADPTYPDMKDLVNATIKYREGFRPFAPAVLKEKQRELFEMDGGQDAYFMERVFRFKKEWWRKVPSVVHYDGSGRLQTVDKDVNPLFHRLITEFHRLSGCPLVLNTSFNINGMPLVETPGDAIDCFYQSGLDALIMGDYLVEKTRA